MLAATQLLKQTFKLKVSVRIRLHLGRGVWCNG